VPQIPCLATEMHMTLDVHMVCCSYFCSKRACSTDVTHVDVCTSSLSYKGRLQAT